MAEETTREPRSVKVAAGVTAASGGFFVGLLAWGPDFGFDLVEMTGVREAALMWAWGIVSLSLGKLARDYVHEFKQTGKVPPWYLRPIANRIVAWVG